MKEQITIQNLLRSSLLEMQATNPSYSLRSFAVKVDVHVGALSSIMNGKRSISREMAERITRRLLVDPQKRAEILELFPMKKPTQVAPIEPLPTRYMEIEAAQFKTIAEWEHYAVLSLMNCADFQDDAAWVAKRLGITENRASEVIKRLHTMGLIRVNMAGRLERTHAKVRSSDDTVNLSLRKSHEVTLDLAKQSLNRDAVTDRDFTYITMATNPTQLKKAKEMIRDFQDKLCEVLEEGPKTEVYRFSTQLFPFTQLQNPSKDEV